MTRQIINGRVGTSDPYQERICQAGKYHNKSRSVPRLEG